MEAPKGLTAEGLNHAVKLSWDLVEGAAGYIVRFFKADKPNVIIKTRYVQGSERVLHGLSNGAEYLVDICAFNYEGEDEILTARSEKVPFTPISKVLNSNTMVGMMWGEHFQLEWEYQNTVPRVAFTSMDDSIVEVNQEGVLLAKDRGETKVHIAMLDLDGKPTTDPTRCFDVNVFVDRNIRRKQPRELVANIFLTGNLMCGIPDQEKYRDRRFDFTPAFSKVNDVLKQSDYTVGVLETMCDDIRAYESDVHRSFKGAPNYNSPSTFINALKQAGFNGLVTATNHNCDAGFFGLERTVESIRTHGMDNIGALSDNPVIKNINGIKVAFIALSMLNNGMDSVARNTDRDLARYSKEYATTLVEEAQMMGADFIIGIMHWGTVNTQIATSTQKKAAQFLAELGVGLIVGSEPNVIQKMETVLSRDGREVPVVYSMGNFFSSMADIQDNTISELVNAKIKLNQHNDFIAEVTLLPCYCCQDNGYTAVQIAIPDSGAQADYAIAHAKSINNDDNVISTIDIQVGAAKILAQGSLILSKIVGDKLPANIIGINISPLTVFNMQPLPPNHSLGETQIKPNVYMDLTKGYEKLLRANHFEYLLLDFYEAAAISMAEYDGEYFTVNDGFLASEFFKRNRPKLRRIKAPAPFEIWQPLMDNYIRKVNKYFSKEKIILIRHQYGAMTQNHGHLVNMEEPTGINNTLHEMEEYFIERVQPVIIDVAKFYFHDAGSDVDSDYEPLFYEHCRKIVQSIAGANSTQFYFGEVDENIWMKRVLKYYSNMMAHGYEKYILDFDCAADELIAGTSLEFVSFYQNELINLKHHKISLDYSEVLLNKPETMEIRQAVKVVREFKNNPDAIHDYGFYSVAFKYNFRCLDKLISVMNSKLPDDLRVVRQTLEPALLLYNNKETLNSYLTSKARFVVDVWGSDVSKTVLATNEDDIMVQNLVTLQNPILMDMPPLDCELPEDISKYDDSETEKDIIVKAATRQGKSTIESSNADWIVVDLYDVVSLVKTYNDTHFEFDERLSRTDFYRDISKQCRTGFIYDKISTEECMGRVRSFAKFLKEKYGNHIILIRTCLKNGYISLDNKLHPIKSDPDILAKNNTFIYDMETLFNYETDCFVIDISKFYFADERFPMGGSSEVHYEKEFYEKACRHVLRILRGNTNKLYDQVDKIYLLKRDAMLKNQ